MEISAFGRTLWVPDEDTPCLLYPDVWSDNKLYNHRDHREAAKRQCKDECPFVTECLEDAMNLERGMPLKFRRENGIRGALTPTERQQLAKNRRKNAA